MSPIACFLYVVVRRILWSLAVMMPCLLAVMRPCHPLPRQTVGIRLAVTRLFHPLPRQTVGITGWSHWGPLREWLPLRPPKGQLLPGLLRGQVLPGPLRRVPPRVSKKMDPPRMSNTVDTHLWVCFGYSWPEKFWNNM